MQMAIGLHADDILIISEIVIVTTLGWLSVIGSVSKVESFDDQRVVLRSILRKRVILKWSEFRRPALRFDKPMRRVMLRRAQNKFWQMRTSYTVLLDGDGERDAFLVAAKSHLGIRDVAGITDAVD